MYPRRIPSASLVLAIALTACGPAASSPTVLDTPSASPPANASPPPSASVVPSPSPGPDLTPTPTEAPPAFAEWQRIDLPDPAPDVFGGAPPAGIVYFDGRFVAIGTVAASCCAAGETSKNRGVVWASKDGESWRLHDPLPTLAHASIHGLVTDGRRLVAVGTYADPATEDPEGLPPAATWTSTDAVHWQRSSGATPSLIAVTPAGFLGLVRSGWPGEDSSARSATSRDGLEWSYSSSFIPVDIRGIAVDPAGAMYAIGVMPGESEIDGEPSDTTVVLRSDDGGTWTKPALIAVAASPRSVAVGQAGVVVALASQLVDESTFWCIDRIRAERLPLVPGGNGPSWGVLAAGDALLAIGNRGDDVVVWLSLDDGATWGLVPAQAELRGELHLSKAITTSEGLLIVGTRWDAESGHPMPVVWRATR